MISGEVISIIIFIIGCYTIVAIRDIVRTTIGIGIMAGGVVLYFLTSESKYLLPPIGERLGAMADPLPQALMITNIIVGMASTAVALGIFIKIYRKYDTARWDTVHRRQGEEL